MTGISAENPSVDTVLDILNKAMVEGASLPIDSDGLEVLAGKYRASIERRLNVSGSWAREGDNVKNAAQQLGVIATAIARLKHKKQITQEMVEDAAEVVEKHCAIGRFEGRWCDARL